MVTSLDRTQPVPTWADKGVPGNNLRHPRANGARPIGAFTRGNRGSWGESAEGIVPRRTVALAERLPVERLAHPWADLPDPVERPDTHDGRVIISGRFNVKSIIPADDADESAEPTACTECWMITCECGKW